MTNLLPTSPLINIIIRILQRFHTLNVYFRGQIEKKGVGIKKKITIILYFARVARVKIFFFEHFFHFFWFLEIFTVYRIEAETSSKSVYVG